MAEKNDSMGDKKNDYHKPIEKLQNLKNHRNAVLIYYNSVSRNVL